MCGIVGVSRFGDVENEHYKEAAIFMATNLIELSESRGKDATGIATLFDDGNFFGQKFAKEAKEFIARFGGKSIDYDGFLNVVRDYEEDLRTIIGHCRKKSVGLIKNINNHPIKANNILGVHNGTLKNHDIIFDNLKCDRDGDVDSEAIFRLLDHFSKGCKEPFTVETLTEVYKRLEGSFSIIAFNANNPNQLVTGRDGRPAEFCLIKPLNMLLIASDKDFIETTIWNYNKMSYLYKASGFLKIKESNVDFESLPDDTLALFDLTKEINKDTKLKDLYEEAKIPKNMDRIWKTKTTYSANNNVYGSNYRRSTSGYNSNNSNSKKEAKESKKEEKETSVGKAWNEKLKIFETVTITSDITNTVIDLEKKVKMPLDEAVELNEQHNIKEDSNTTAELNKCNASVEDFTHNQSVDITTIKAEEKEVTDEEELNKITTVKHLPANIVSISELKKKAKADKKRTKDEIEAKKQGYIHSKAIEKFQTEEEVAELCNTDVISLRQLPLNALANRIVIKTSSKSFFVGWIEKGKNLLFKQHKPTNKTAKAEKHIRVLKSITRLFDGVLHEEITEDKLNKWFKLVTEYSNCAGYDEISKETIGEIFNKGDLENLPNVRNISETLEAATKKD